MQKRSKLYFRQASETFADFFPEDGLWENDKNKTIF